MINSGDIGVLPAEEAAKPVGSDAAREATAEEVSASSTSTPAAPPLLHGSSSLQQLIGTLPGIDMSDPRLLVSHTKLLTYL